MLILSARDICAISIDTRCCTGSDWLSQGQEAVAPAAWTTVPEEGGASAASGRGRDRRTRARPQGRGQCRRDRRYYPARPSVSCARQRLHDSLPLLLSSHVLS